ncbi:hypothetical protein INR49_010875 [Caranx melampygus]|nr:hypothetical protein INR49_010875 [Caranx melampygus]
MGEPWEAAGKGVSVGHILSQEGRDLIAQSQMAEPRRTVMATVGATGGRGRLTSDTGKVPDTSYTALCGGMAQGSLPNLINRSKDSGLSYLRCHPKAVATEEKVQVEPPQTLSSVMKNDFLPPPPLQSSLLPSAHTTISVMAELEKLRHGYIGAGIIGAKMDSGYNRRDMDSLSSPLPLGLTCLQELRSPLPDYEHLLTHFRRVLDRVVVVGEQAQRMEALQTGEL